MANVMTVLVYTNNNAPGVFRFVDLEGNEDSLLVSPGRTYRLQVTSILWHEKHVTYVVEREGSLQDLSAQPSVVLRRRRAETPETPAEGNQG